MASRIRRKKMIKLLIPIMAILLSGCVSMASLPPKVSQVAYKPMMKVEEPENGKIVLAVYAFGDLTGQQKPNDNFGEMSKAITQGASNLLVKALKDVGAGQWFRVVERESLQSLLQERKLIRTTRQMTQGDAAKPLGPMLYAGAYLTGGIVGYDSNTLSGGYGHRILGIGIKAQYRQDTVTVVLRLINVVTSEVELVVMVEKTIMSVGAGKDKFKYLDLDTKLLEVEFGAALNEPVTYAVRKTIEGAVVELIEAGEEKGLWKYKPKPEPEPESFDAPPLNEEELLEEIIEIDNEIREEVKEEASQPTPVEEVVVEEKELEVEAETTPAPQPEQVEEPVKIEEPLSDAIKCESGPHHYRCYDETSYSNNSSEFNSDK